MILAMLKDTVAGEKQTGKLILFIKVDTSN